MVLELRNRKYFETKCRSNVRVCKEAYNFILMNEMGYRQLKKGVNKLNGKLYKKTKHRLYINH